MALRFNKGGRMIFAHTYTPRTGVPIAPVEVTAHAALGAAAAVPPPPLTTKASPKLEVLKIVDLEPYLGVADVDVDVAFLLGLGI
jgi:hypothetical protein